MPSASIPPDGEVMELIDSFRQEGTPPVYTFVFDHYDPHTRLYGVLPLRDDNQCMFSPFLIGEYHLRRNNSHLWPRIAFPHIEHSSLPPPSTSPSYPSLHSN